MFKKIEPLCLLIYASISELPQHDKSQAELDDKQTFEAKTFTSQECLQVRFSFK